MTSGTPEPIITIGAEGGSITLFGVKTADGTWHYLRTTSDQTPTFLGTEEGDAIQSNSGWVKTWAEALALLDKYPWARLYALGVHPEFRERVWNAVQQRMQEQQGSHAQRSLERWEKRCGINKDPNE